MGEIERFEECDGLSEVVHPFLSQGQRLQLFHFGDNRGLRASDMIVLYSGPKGHTLRRSSIVDTPVKDR